MHNHGAEKEETVVPVAHWPSKSENSKLVKCGSLKENGPPMGVALIRGVALLV